MSPFVDLVKAHACPICFETMKDASITACGHSFCLDCIKKAQSQSHNSSCPSCRQDIKVLIPNYALRSSILASQTAIIAEQMQRAVSPVLSPSSLLSSASSYVERVLSASPDTQNTATSWPREIKNILAMPCSTVSEARNKLLILLATIVQNDFLTQGMKKLLLALHIDDETCSHIKKHLSLPPTTKSKITSGFELVTHVCPLFSTFENMCRHIELAVNKIPDSNNGAFFTNRTQAAQNRHEVITQIDKALTDGARHSMTEVISSVGYELRYCLSLFYDLAPVHHRFITCDKDDPAKRDTAIRSMNERLQRQNDYKDGFTSKEDLRHFQARLIQMPLEFS